MSSYAVVENPPVTILAVKTAFDQLTTNEKLYAYWLYRAVWEGSPICFQQTSHESGAILDLIQTYFYVIVNSFDSHNTTNNFDLANGILNNQSSSLIDRFDSINDMSNKFYTKLKYDFSIKGLTEQDLQHFLEYCATFYDNHGNYYGFGDAKFIPRISKDKFITVIKSAIKNDNGKDLPSECIKIIDKIYSTEENELTIDFNDSGHGSTAYYSDTMTKADVEYVNNFMTKINMSPYNTKISKSGNDFTISVASVRRESKTKYNKLLSEKDDKVKIYAVSGDYRSELHFVNSCLENAQCYAENETQKDMLESYIKHFEEGDIDDHKQAQIHWVKDIQPSVETNIGFIESYRDPSGVRGEWEGFVAVVNKEITKKFSVLVDNAPNLLSLLPWGPLYEKDHFLKPDFTSLEVIAFGSNGIPSGINIPNYNDIRQNIGFKNVSLGNVINGRNISSQISFLSDHDQDLYKKYLTPAYEIQVGLHELLGHGSGKLFTHDDHLENTNQNNVGFYTSVEDSIDGVKNPPGFYKEGETFNSVFGKLSSSYEECRAECVGLYLCVNETVLNVFGHDDKETADNIVYVNWLTMVRAGLKGLEFYKPESNNWGQAHMQARWVILQVLLKCDSLIKFTYDEQTNHLEIGIDREKIYTDGVVAIGDFLTKLQVYKATADIVSASNMFNELSTVNDYWLKVRAQVIREKQPRHLFIQPVLTNDDNVVTLHEFDLSQIDNHHSAHVLSNVLRYA